ncbi:hypothetical protein C8F04DRAFT_1398868 [Mycena alexandri]|uniref:Uncharacterized protein n=1 Tax=Mycena alexandri TaxID=1745969 RepID=A0AAD6SMS6_9AGAR|nr:hypothetical protein C8F04DRAFT_1398868 [Mycena alexandri]
MVFLLYCSWNNVNKFKSTLVRYNGSRLAVAAIPATHSPPRILHLTSMSTSATEAPRPDYILVRVNGPSAAFIEEEAARVNAEYHIISESERQELHQLYEEKIALGENEAEVRTLITDQIRCMHDIYVQAREIMAYAAEKGIDIPLDIDLDNIHHGDSEKDHALERVLGCATPRWAACREESAVVKVKGARAGSPCFDLRKDWLLIGQLADGQLQGALDSLDAIQALLRQDILDHGMQSYLGAINKAFNKRRVELVNMGQKPAKDWMSRTWEAHKLNTLAKTLQKDVNRRSKDEKMTRDIEEAKQRLAAKAMGFDQNPANRTLKVDIPRKQLASLVHELNALSIPHYSFPSRTH